MGLPGSERNNMDEQTKRWMYLREIGDNSGAAALARECPWVENAASGGDNFDWSCCIE